MIESVRARALLLSALLCALVAHSHAETPDRVFRLGTGGIGGTYFPIGSLLSQAISAPRNSDDVPAGSVVGGLLVVPQISNGSIANVRDVRKGILDGALVQADVAHWAYQGTGMFSTGPAHARLRALGYLYAESLHLVASVESGIRSVADLRGRRVSLDESGSGTLHDAVLILGYYGIDLSDIRPTYLKPTFAARALASGDLDAFFIFAGYPAAAVSQLAGTAGARLVGIEGAAIDAVLTSHPYFDRGVIPAGIYGAGIIPAGMYKGNGDTPTLTVGAQLVVTDRLSEELAYQMTRALWHERTMRLVTEGHPKGVEIDPRSALNGVTLPLHPGAARYYREVGLLD
ncbi:MAG: TAXI family TRAP transporter solute-binding subunit [Pseudomonadota bacterium]